MRLLGGKRPATLGVVNGKLAPCPSTSNCLSSDASDETHFVRAFSLARPPEAAWQAILEAVEGLPRTTVVLATDSYVHVEFQSALFGFVDDLELHLRGAEDVVAVRSASRVGGYDLGANRRRVERLRERLRAQGAVR